MSLTVKENALESLRTSQLDKTPELVAEMFKYVDEARDELQDMYGNADDIHRQKIEESLDNLELLGAEIEKFIRRAYGVIAMTGELGEFAELVKKALYHDKPADPSKVAGELGDIKWCWNYAVAAEGLDHEAVCRGNMEKLRKRYPNGYNHADCAARVDTIGTNAPKALELA